MCCDQSCPAVCDHMDCSLPGFSIHGTFQTSILETVVTSFSRQSSWLRDWTRVSCVSCIGSWFLYQLNHQGSYYNNFFGRGSYSLTISCCLDISPTFQTFWGMQRCGLCLLGRRLPHVLRPVSVKSAPLESALLTQLVQIIQGPWGWWPRSTTVTVSKDWGKSRSFRDFPDGLVVKTPHSQYSGPRFDPWSGN